MTGRRPRPGPDPAEELRELIREAHGAVKDLTGLLREVRQVIADGAEQARQAAQKAGRTELARYSRHLQQELNRSAAETNAAIERAQKHVIDCVILDRMEMDRDQGKARFFFKGAPFDADVPLPEGLDLDE